MNRFLCIIILLFFATKGFCQQVIWEGNVSDQWLIGDNWSKGNVPSASDSVFIPTQDVSGSGSKVTLYDEAPIIKHLHIEEEAQLTISDVGLLWVSESAGSGIITLGTLTNLGIIKIDSTDLHGLENHGVFVMEESSSLIIRKPLGRGISNTDQLNNMGEITIDSASQGIYNSDIFTNHHIMIITAPNIDGFHNLGNFENKAGASLSVSNTRNSFGDGLAHFGTICKNFGSMLFSNTKGGIETYPVFENYGIITVDSFAAYAIRNLSASFTNFSPGLIDLKNGQGTAIITSAPFLNHGTINITEMDGNGLISQGDFDNRNSIFIQGALIQSLPNLSFGFVLNFGGTYMDVVGANLEINGFESPYEVRLDCIFNALGTLEIVP